MLDRKVRKRIEWAFYNYDVLKTLAAEYLVELAETGITAQYDGAGIHSGHISNPTEVKGVKVAGNTAAIWCKVVENTKKYFETVYWETNIKKYQLIAFRYTKKYNERKICYELSIERETMYRWIKEILYYAYIITVQLGLNKVELE